MAFGVEEYNQTTAEARLKSGFKMPFSQESNKAPDVVFVDGIGPNASKVGEMSYGNPMPILDSWVTRYPNAKLKS